jgi:hypothetical protein
VYPVASAASSGTSRYRCFAAGAASRIATQQSIARLTLTFKVALESLWGDCYTKAALQTQQQKTNRCYKTEIPKHATLACNPSSKDTLANMLPFQCVSFA